MTAFYLPAGLILFAIGLLLIVKKQINRLREQALAKVQIKLGTEEILVLDPGANFFGQKSKGVGQIRGNCVLAFSPKKIVFEMLLPRRSFEIPISAVSKVMTEKSFLGKRVAGATLLVVHTVGGLSGEDAYAWAVKNPERLLLELDDLIEKATD